MTYEPLSPTTAALLLVDHQTRVLEWGREGTAAR
jgi:hypothetical protein